MQGKLKSGFSFNISKTKLDDMRFLKLLRETKKDQSVVTDLVEFLFGDDEEKFYQSLQKKDGRVPITDVMSALNELFEMLGKTEKK